MHLRQCHAINLNHVARKSWFHALWMRTMRDAAKLDVHIQGSLFSSTQRQYFGTPRGKIQLKHPRTMDQSCLLAMRIAIEMIEGLRWYKLRMKGIKVTDECAVFCDNFLAVVTNSRPKSTLKKKMQRLIFTEYVKRSLRGRFRLPKKVRKRIFLTS